MLKYYDQPTEYQINQRNNLLLNGRKIISEKDKPLIELCQEYQLHKFDTACWIVHHSLDYGSINFTSSKKYLYYRHSHLVIPVRKYLENIYGDIFESQLIVSTQIINSRYLIIDLIVKEPYLSSFGYKYICIRDTPLVSNLFETKETLYLHLSGLEYSLPHHYCLNLTLPGVRCISNPTIELQIIQIVRPGKMSVLTRAKSLELLSIFEKYSSSSFGSYRSTSNQAKKIRRIFTKFRSRDDISNLIHSMNVYPGIISAVGVGIHRYLTKKEQFNPHLILDQICLNNSSNFTISEWYWIQKCGTKLWLELEIAAKLRSHQINFLTEKDLRGMSYFLRFFPNIRYTPDFLLPNGIIIRSRVFHWIELKTNYNDSDRKQLMRYFTSFGPGLVIYEGRYVKKFWEAKWGLVATGLIF